jgi:3-hydroxyacyl-[acyl-carrier-protein] dehydratase
MPGVLQIEALAQAAAILAIETLELAGSGKLVYFMAIEEAKFRAPVEPAACSSSTSASSRSARGCASSGARPASRAR